MMGYAARWSGEVRITPPLTWGEIKNSRQTPGFQDLKLRLNETVQDTDTGQVRTVTADAVVPVTDEPYNGYSIDAELRAVVAEHGATHTIEGRIQGDGPEGNHFAYVVDGGQVSYVVPHLVWPGEEGYDAAAERAALRAVEELAERAREWGIQLEPEQVLAAIEDAGGSNG